MAAVPLVPANEPLRSTVATPPEIVTPCSVVPWGTAVRKPMARALASGPARTAFTLAVATIVLFGAVTCRAATFWARMKYAVTVIVAVGEGDTDGLPE